MPEIIPPPSPTAVLADAYEAVKAAGSRLDQALLVAIEDPEIRARVQAFACDFSAAWNNLAGAAFHLANIRLAMIERNLLPPENVQ